MGHELSKGTHLETMCGRFTNRLTWPEIVQLYRLTDKWLVSPHSNSPARYNIAPTQTAPVMRLMDGEREIAMLRWGLVPSWAKDIKIGSKMINARSEEAAFKPSFRAAWKSRRCLVIADGFYEWPEKSKPRFITLKDGEPFAFAGLWETWKQEDGRTVETFTILTTSANEFMAQVHDRMPVILAEADWSKWLGEIPVTQDELQALCSPFPSERMTCWPVDKAVGNVKNDEPYLVEAIASD